MPQAGIWSKCKIPAKFVAGLLRLIDYRGKINDFVSKYTITKNKAVTNANGTECNVSERWYTHRTQ